MNGILLLLSSIALSSTLACVLHETARGDAHVRLWNRIGRSPRDTIVPLIFSLKNRNVNELEAIATQVSDPRHERYGKYLTLAELTDIIAPEREVVDSVVDHLKQYGVASIQVTASQDFVVTSMPVTVAERLLCTEFHVYERKGANHTTVRVGAPDGTRQYSLPDGPLSKHVQTVGGVLNFPPKHMSVKASSRGGRLRDVYDTPATLLKRYNVPDGTQAKNRSSHQAVLGALQQYFSPSDLQSFFNWFVPTAKGQTATVFGPNDGSNPGIEASLDIQYVMAMGNGVPTEFWSIASDAVFFPLMAALANTSHPPLLLSMSYGSDEEENSEGELRLLNEEFMKAAVRGITLLAASGDDGTSCNADDTAFMPDFPADSPWITAVGATNVKILSSTEVTDDFSGGGFSFYFAMPDYQKEAVAAYIKSGIALPPQKLYNGTGRAYPDVAALGDNDMVIFDDVPTPVSGTSASAPIFTGVMALVNDARLAAGKPALGFLNPLLYYVQNTNPSAFNDITSGCNPGSPLNGDFGCAGWYEGFCAAKGWDPATGLGSPNYVNLVQAFLQYPPAGARP